jgi:negative elongation factor C/D
MKSAGVEEKEINKIVEDHLKQLVIQHFDPKKADTIFENGFVLLPFDFTKDEFFLNYQKGAPEWLEWMIQDAGWRQVIYELSETHRNCLMLNFAIQVTFRWMIQRWSS